MRFSGRLEVEGRVQGTILAEDVRSSAVRVSASGQVDGAIEAAVVHVAGTVNGPIRQQAAGRAIRCPAQRRSSVSGSAAGVWRIGDRVSEIAG